MCLRALAESARRGRPAKFCMVAWAPRPSWDQGLDWDCLEGGVIRQVSQGWHGLLALVSTNLYYHFVHGLDQSRPFVTVGYSSAFRGAHHEADLDRGQANLVNFGGGMNYWFRPNTAVKVEFIDNVRPNRGPNASYWEFRLGLAFALR